VTWAIRSVSPSRTYGGGDADALPARGALGSRLRAHVDAGRIRLLTGFSVQALAPVGDRVSVVVRHADGAEEAITVDRVVAATGFRPDHSIAAELRLDLDPVMGATRALAPLIDPNEHSCGTVPPHGVDELAHPETGYYAVGMKSYGRAPTFLMATGYEQVRSVVAALAGDWQAAREVQLDLPETGVCSSNRDDSAAGDSCCGPAPTAEPAARGLATGISGGLLAAPLTLVALGAAPADALADLADGEDADLVAAAVALQHRAGGDLARLLDGLADAMIRREEARRAAAVATAQARATGAMVTALPALGLLALRAADPAAFALLLSSPLGWAALTASAALALAGHVLIRRLAAVDA
jgi:hypothetical protein